MPTATYSDNRDLLDAEGLAAVERLEREAIASGDLKPGDKIYRNDDVEYTVLDRVEDKDGDWSFGGRAPYGLTELRWDILEAGFRHRVC